MSMHEHMAQSLKHAHETIDALKDELKDYREALAGHERMVKQWETWRESLWAKFLSLFKTNK